MPIKRVLILLAIIASPSFSQIHAGMQWDVRTTGSDSNGGGFDPTVGTPGTDYSQQNSAQIAYTDLIIGSTTSQLTSSANPFSSLYPGNIIKILSGSGCTAGFYEVLSVSGATATMDRAVGTAASTCTGNLGGSLLTIATATGVATAGNVIHIKTGTYAQTSTVGITINTLDWRGYGTTHGDGGTKPLITTSTSGIDLVAGSTDGGILTFANLSFSNTASIKQNFMVQFSTHGSTQWWVFRDDTIDGFTNAINSTNLGAYWNVANISIVNTEIKNCVTAVSARDLVGAVYIQGSYLHDQSSTVVSVGQNAFIDRSEITHNGGTAYSSQGGGAVITNSTIANNNNDALVPSIFGTFFFMSNDLIYGNNGYAVHTSGTLTSPIFAVGIANSRNNAYGANTSGNFLGYAGSPGDVALTADPFVNATAGNFALNNTIGGGVAVKGAGFPGTFPGGLSVGAPDIGAVQTGSTPSSSVFSYGFSELMAPKLPEWLRSK